MIMAQGMPKRDIGGVEGVKSIFGGTILDLRFKGDPIPNAGSAYAYQFEPGTSQWTGEQTLQPSDATAGDQFGFAIAMDGEAAIIGAYESAGTGAAYIFGFDTETSQWGEEQKVLASDGASDDSFGKSVAMSGEVAIVGAQDHDANGSDSGAAYV